MQRSAELHFLALSLFALRESRDSSVQFQASALPGSRYMLGLLIVMRGTGTPRPPGLLSSPCHPMPHQGAIGFVAKRPIHPHCACNKDVEGSAPPGIHECRRLVGPDRLLLSAGVLHHQFVVPLARDLQLWHRHATLDERPIDLQQVSQGRSTSGG